METRFDTVILGMGPAGAACGIALRKRGASVCAVDKAVFPRNKTCAGLVTAKARRMIGELLGEDFSESLFCDSCDEIRLFRRERELVSARLGSSVGFVDRKHFDNALVERYKKLGGVLFDGKKVSRLDYRKNTISLGGGREIGYKNLVLADGALSMARGRAARNYSRLAFGIEAHIPKELLPVDSVNLYFEYLPSGYVWAFPHGETVCVGAADRFRKGREIKPALCELLNASGIDTDKLKFSGAFLPYGYIVPQDRLPRNVMLAGDAGGFTDPISGEGLFMSMKTGICAAEAMAETDAKQAYLEKVKPLMKTVRDGRKIRDIMYTPAIHRQFLRKVEGKSGLVRFFYENQVEEYNYEYSKLRKLFADYKNTPR